MTKTTARIWAGALAFALVAVACGGGGSDDEESAPTTAPTETLAPMDDGPSDEPPPAPETTAEPAPTTTAAPTSRTPGPDDRPACASSWNGLSCLMPDGTWMAVDDTNGLSNSFVNAVAVCDDGTILVANSSGLDLFDGTRWAQFVDPFEFGGPDELACQSPDNMWAVNFDDVAHWNGSEWQTWLEGSTGVGFIDDIELDAAGLPWVAGSDGLAFYDGAQWIVYNETTAGFRSDSADDITITPDGQVLGVLLFELVTFDGAGGWTAADYDGTATSLASDGVDTYIGTFNAGINLVSGPTTVTLDRSSGDLTSDFVNVMQVDDQGRIWVGTDYGLAVFADGALVASWLMSDGGLLDDQVRDLSVGGIGPQLEDFAVAPPNGSLSGTVVDLNGAGIPNAMIEICVEDLGDSFEGATPCDGQPFSLSTTSGADGSFTIPDVPRGRYTFVTNPGEGWIQLTDEFGSFSDRILVEGATDMGEVVAVPEEEEPPEGEAPDDDSGPGVGEGA